MICYLDASALVKALVSEPGREQVLSTLEEHTCLTSRWTEVEVSSALARRAREGALNTEDHDRGVLLLEALLGRMYLVELRPAVIALSRALLKRRTLRSGDAIQLASALRVAEELGRPLAFLGFDERLCAAAAAEGLSAP